MGFFEVMAMSLFGIGVAFLGASIATWKHGPPNLEYYKCSQEEAERILSEIKEV